VDPSGLVWWNPFTWGVDDPDEDRSPDYGVWEWFSDDAGNRVPLWYGIAHGDDKWGYNHIMDRDVYHQETLLYDAYAIRRALRFGNYEAIRDGVFKITSWQVECDDDKQKKRKLTVILDYSSEGGGYLGVRTAYFGKWKHGYPDQDDDWFTM
jgi:hypothetical protein